MLLDRVEQFGRTQTHFCLFTVRYDSFICSALLEWSPRSEGQGGGAYFHIQMMFQSSDDMINISMCSES